MEGWIWSATYNSIIIQPFYSQHFFLLTVHILDWETTAAVPNFDCMIIRTWSKDIWLRFESNTTCPFWVSFVSLHWSWRLSSIPHPNLTIFMRRQNLVSLCIKWCWDWISGQNCFWSRHLDYISDGDFMRAWRWNYFLIVDPIKGFNSSLMNLLWCQLW